MEQIKKGELSEEACRERFLPRLRRLVEEAEERRRRQEAADQARRQREEAAARERERVKAETCAEFAALGANGESDAAEARRERLMAMSAAQDQKVAQMEELRAEAMAELDVIVPTLEEATEGLRRIKLIDCQELMALMRPPQIVRTVATAVCILLQMRPVKTRGDENQFIDDYYSPFKKMVTGDRTFVSKLADFDKDNISPATIEKLRPLVEGGELIPQNARMASVMAMHLCNWVLAMYNYHFVAVRVNPIRQSLIQLESEYAELKLRVETWKGESDKLDIERP